MSAETLLEVPGLRRRAALSEQDRAEMFALLDRHFEGVSEAQFARDLAEKNWVIEIRKGARLVGFSTLLLGETQFRGEAITVLYSGDTIVAPEMWGSPILSRSWIAAVNRLRAEAPDRPCYWLLLTSGFRTYRFPPVFWREFYPHHARPTPPDKDALLRALARERYGAMYDECTGIVRFPSPQRLRGELGTLPPGREQNPHVAYFLARNPGHAAGDELVCLTEICAANLTPAGRRVSGS